MDQRNQEASRITLTGSVVNLLLVVLKLVGGFLGHSQALVVDAVHSLSDFLSDIIVLAGLKLGAKPQDEDHNYGHGKLETLASALVGLILLLIGAGFFREAALQLMALVSGEVPPSPGVPALLVALVSILAKELLYRATLAVSRKLNSSALRANAWHHRSDALSSVAGAAGITGVLLLGERGILFDPLAALVISFMVIKAGFDILKEAVQELTDASLSQDDREKISASIDSVEGVSDLHNLRTRKVGNRVVLDAHIRVQGDLTVNEGHAIASKVEEALQGLYGLQAIISIHVEPRREDKKNPPEK